MSGGVWRCACGASPRGSYRRKFRLFAMSVLGTLLGFAAAGCSSDTGSLGPLTAGRRASITIESIDGPPPALTRKLATTINEEAEARQFVIVPREEAAQFIVRSYLSTHVERDKTSVSWVWDVYGADKRRALRITGEEQGAKIARDSNKGDDWAGVDDRVLRRIAQSGMDRIVGYLNSPEAEPVFPLPAMIPLTTNAAIPLTTSTTPQPPPS
jgi:hypothetical protein